MKIKSKLFYNPTYMLTKSYIFRVKNFIHNNKEDFGLINFGEDLSMRNLTLGIPLHTYTSESDYTEKQEFSKDFEFLYKIPYISIKKEIDTYFDKDKNLVTRVRIPNISVLEDDLNNLVEDQLYSIHDILTSIILQKSTSVDQQNIEISYKTHIAYAYIQRLKEAIVELEYETKNEEDDGSGFEYNLQTIEGIPGLSYSNIISFPLKVPQGSTLRKRGSIKQSKFEINTELILDPDVTEEVLLEAHEILTEFLNRE